MYLYLYVFVFQCTCICELCTIKVRWGGLGKIELDANIGSLEGHSPTKYRCICICTFICDLWLRLSVYLSLLVNQQNPCRSWHSWWISGTIRDACHIWLRHRLQNYNYLWSDHLHCNDWHWCFSKGAFLILICQRFVFENSLEFCELLHYTQKVGPCRIRKKEAPEKCPISFENIS